MLSISRLVRLRQICARIGFFQNPRVSKVLVHRVDNSGNGNNGNNAPEVSQEMTDEQRQKIIEALEEQERIKKDFTIY